jgi:hypothetical protein
VTVNIAAGAAHDVAGNGNTAATQLSRMYSPDTTSPTVTLSSTTSATVREPFYVTVTFSESVTGFEIGDISLTNATASNLGGSGTTYALG